MKILSDPLTLKKLSSIGSYKEDGFIPIVYGDLSKSPIKITNLTGNTYIVSEGLCSEIVGVQVDGQETTGFEPVTLYDNQESAHQGIELSAPAPDGSTITATVKGRVNATTGALIENPSDVMADIFARIGASLDLSGFAAECNNDSLKVAGVIDSEITPRQAINDVCESVGAIWTRNSARLYPAPVPIQESATFPRFDFRNIRPGSLRVSASLREAADTLRVEYDYIQSLNEFGAYLELRSRPASHKRPSKASAKWLRGSKAAFSVGQRKLSRTAGIPLAISFDTDRVDIFPATWAIIDHPLVPVGGYMMILSVGKSYTKHQSRVTGELILSAPNDFVTIGSSSRLPTEQSAAVEVAIEDGRANFTLSDNDNNPIVGATVYLDGRSPTISDNRGRVSFEYVPGTHTLGVEAPGYVPYEIPVVL
ncbi:MAG: carboxypeptidase-like regulatory domain-containing protein [Betaproteobacteria bacterium]